MAPNWKKLGLTAAGVAAGAAGIGLGVERVLVARERRRPDPAADQVIPSLDGATHREVATSEDGEIHVVERGEGPPIVLVHGITLSAEIWRYQLADLAAAGYRAIAVDLRGHGRSNAPGGGLTLERLAEDLREVLEALDLHDAVLVGHSMGGMVVMGMLAADPGLAAGAGRVGGVVLASTSASPVAGSGVPAAGALMRVINPLAARGAALTGRLPGGVLPPGELAYLLTRGVFGSHPSPKAVELTRSIVAQTPARVVAELAVALSVYDQRPSLERITVPVAVAVGSRDSLTPLHQAQEMAQRIRRAQLVVFPECGHMVMLERRDEFNTVVIQVAQRVAAGLPARNRQPRDVPRAGERSLGRLPIDRRPGGGVAEQP